MFWMRCTEFTPKCLVIRILIGFVAGYIYIFNTVWADDRCVAVYYPEVREPYRSVLEEIIKGIEQKVEYSLRRYPINQDSKQDGVDGNAGVKCNALIGLGRGGFHAVSGTNIPAVVGGVLVQPGDNSGIPGVSLMPDPMELFLRLKHFVPNVQTVFVIYSFENTGLLIKEASRAAQVKGIKLVAQEATDLQTAVVMYRDVLKKINPETDALWLLHDPLTVDNDVVLPIVLEQAWKRKLIIFSSQGAHVQNGVLFSVYPDNTRLGLRLGEMAQKCAEKNCADLKMTLLQDLFTAVNVRTATRLNIQIHPRRDSYVDLVFPR